MASENDNLRVKTARSSMAMAGLSMVMKPINLISSILLARWLEPEYFGTVGLCLILIGFASMFTGFGLPIAVIQSPSEEGKTAFFASTITSLSGFVLAGLIAVSAVPLARILGDVTVAPYLRVLTIVIVLRGIGLIPTALLKKKMLFGRVAQISVIAQLTYIVITLGLAFFGFGVWSLVVGQISIVFVTTFLTWIICPGWEWLIPKPLDKKLIRDLVGYGMNITGGNALGYIIGNWDDWLVGRYLGTASLGLYQKAYDFMDKNVVEISGNIIGGVLLSTFSRIQGNLERLQRIYIRAVRLIWLIVVPIALGVAVLAPQLVPILFGSKWSGMIPALQIFSLMIITRAFSYNTSSLLSAVGRPRIVAIGAIILLVVMVPLAIFMLRYGITGIAFSALFSDFFGVIYYVFQVNKVLPGTGRKMITSGFPMLAGGLLMVVIVELSKPVVFNEIIGAQNILALFILVGVGGIVYLGFMLLTQRELLRELIILSWEALNAKERFARFLPKKSTA